MIAPNLYARILENIPIVCVDLLITRENGEVLLVKRANEPLKGWWWIPGGRVLFSERPLKAVRRKALEEVGLEVYESRFIGFYDDDYSETAFGTKGHSISLVFECKARGEVRLDHQSSDYKWGKIPPRLTKLLTTHKETL